METQPPAALAWFLLLTSPLAVSWCFAEVCRMLCARGTRLRYQWSSIERTLRYVAGINFLLSAFWDIHFGNDVMLFVLDCLSCAVWLFLFQKKRADGEDDDFWTGRGKKFKKHLQKSVQHLSGSRHLAPTAS